MILRGNRGVGAMLAFSAIAVSGAASAGGFYIQEQSAAGVGRAQAGNVAAADDASTIYYNPAGMTQLPGVQVDQGIDLIVPDAGLTDMRLGDACDSGGDWRTCDFADVSCRRGLRSDLREGQSCRCGDRAGAEDDGLRRQSVHGARSGRISVVVR